MRPTRRAFLSGGAAAALSATAGLAQQRRLFDSHCHIIDHRFPIVASQGYTPPNFPLEDYLAQAKSGPCCARNDPHGGPSPAQAAADRAETVRLLERR